MKIGVLAILVSSYCAAQTTEDTRFIFESNLPPRLHEFYKLNNFIKLYDINTHLNPFYLRGDFDGDKEIDYALAIVERSSKKKGILIYHPKTKKHFICGAGKAIKRRNGDVFEHDGDYKWMDAWDVSDEKKVALGGGETGKIQLIGEAIHIQALEMFSGLIYWTGTEYRWYQQGI